MYQLHLGSSSDVCQRGILNFMWLGPHLTVLSDSFKLSPTFDNSFPLFDFPEGFTASMLCIFTLLRIFNILWILQFFPFKLIQQAPFLMDLPAFECLSEGLLHGRTFEQRKKPFKLFKVSLLYQNEFLMQYLLFIKLLMKRLKNRVCKK